MPSPETLAHVVFKTNDVSLLRDWWCNALEAKVQYGTEDLCFLAYDEEHHRIAIFKAGDYIAHDRNSVGLDHIAFTFADLGELIKTYERLSLADIRPWWEIRHGPTLSIYYRDPDGNQVEFQVDVFKTAEEANEYMYGPEFSANPIGVEFHMADVVRDFKAGVPEETLLRRPNTIATA